MAGGRVDLPDLSEASTALVVKPSSLGDIVHTLPAVSALKRAYSHLSIRWLVNTEWAPLLEGNRDIDDIVVFPRREFRGPAGLPRAARWAAAEFRSWQPDIVFDFQGLFRSGALAKRSGAPHRIGLSDSREGSRFFYSHVVKVERDAHAVDRYLGVPRAFGIEVPEDRQKISFALPPGTPAPGLPEQFVALHPFSRGRGKSLDGNSVGRFCEVLSPEIPVVVVGNSGLELPDLGGAVIDLTNRTDLGQLIWIMRRARFVASVDSGPMHIAAAITSDVVGLHAWSDPRKVGPYHPEAWVSKGTEIQRVGDYRPDPNGGDDPLTGETAGRVAVFLLQRIFGSEGRSLEPEAP